MNEFICYICGKDLSSSNLDSIKRIKLPGNEEHIGYCCIGHNGIKELEEELISPPGDNKPNHLQFHQHFSQKRSK